MVTTRSRPIRQTRFGIPIEPIPSERRICRQTCNIPRSLLMAEEYVGRSTNLEDLHKSRTFGTAPRETAC
jgi:hypothetical protein